MILLMYLTYAKAQINTYVQNKKWYWYLPFWLFGLYLFIKLLSFELGGELPFFVSIAQAFDFVLHEMAHLLFAFLPPIFVAFAGSGAELFLGAALIVTAFLTRSYFASLFCFLWFMLATQSVADYMADARTQALPLVSFGGGDPTHDWHFILDKLGLLESDTLLAGLLRGFGTILAVLALVFTAWLMYRMASFKSVEDKPVAKDIAPGAGVPNIPKSAVNSSSLYPDALRGPLGAHQNPKDKK